MTHSTETEFVEAMGLILQNDGLPRIAGRLLGYFVLHGGPFSFAELGEELKISRGSVSTNTRLLEDLGAIERVTKCGERQDFFRLASNPYARLIERFIERSRKACATVERASAQLSDSDTQTRMTDLASFYKIMGEACSTALDNLHGTDTSYANDCTDSASAPLNDAIEALSSARKEIRDAC